MYDVELTWFQPYNWHTVVENFRNLFSQHTTAGRRERIGDKTHFSMDYKLGQA